MRSMFLIGKERKTNDMRCTSLTRESMKGEDVHLVLFLTFWPKKRPQTPSTVSFSMRLSDKVTRALFCINKNFNNYHFPLDILLHSSLDLVPIVPHRIHLHRRGIIIYRVPWSRLCLCFYWPLGYYMQWPLPPVFRCCDVLSMFVLSKWQVGTLFGAPDALTRLGAHTFLLTFVVWSKKVW